MANLKTEDLGDGIRLLTLSRAPVNALNAGFLVELEAAFRDANEDDAVRVLVLNSDLKVLSAGMDLKEASEFSDADQTAIVDGLNAAYLELYRIPKPVITLVNRAAIAGGMFFVLASDFILADTGAKLGLTEVRVGVDFPICAMEIARAEMTPLTFKRVVLSGQNVVAEDAVAMGLINEVVTPDALMDRGLEMAREYARIPPLTFANIKTQMRKTIVDKVAKVVADKSDPKRNGWFNEETRDSMRALLAAATRK